MSDNKPHEHSPMRPLYEEYKSKSTGEVVSRKLIGYQCQCNCGRIYTVNGNRSEAQLPFGIANAKVRNNGRHYRRISALKHDPDR